MLCEDIEQHHAVAIAERLRAAAAKPFCVDGNEITLSAAVGSCRVHSADPDDVLREADRRMYETKRRTTAEPGDESADSGHRRGHAAAPTAGVDMIAAGWAREHPGDVLEELDPAVEGAAVDHVEGDVGVAVVDPLLAGAPVMTGKTTTRNRSTRPASSSERHRVRLPIVRIDRAPSSFISRTASTASRLTRACSPRPAGRSACGRRRPWACSASDVGARLAAAAAKP